VGLVILTSAAGAPGVTTLGVGLALSWPRSVVLVDADPSAPHAVLAGFLRGKGAVGKGLVRVAEAHRERRPLREAVVDQTIELAEDTAHRRLFLPGFTRAANAALFGPVWPDLTDTLVRLEEVDVDVIVDAGRLEAGGLPSPLVERGGRLVLVTRTSLRAVAAARVAAPVLIEQARVSAAEPPGAVLVGPGRPYGRQEIGTALALPVLGEVGYDPRAAGVLSDGERRTRQFDRSDLVRSVRQLAEQLADGLQRSALRMGAVG
jgi:hypothetical protein